MTTHLLPLGGTATAEEPRPRQARVAIFRAAGRTTRTQASAIVGQLRAHGITAAECADRSDLPADHALRELAGDYDAVLQIGEGAGAAAALARALEIPLVEAFFAPAQEVAATVRAAIESNRPLAS